MSVLCLVFYVMNESVGNCDLNMILYTGLKEIVLKVEQIELMKHCASKPVSMTSLLQVPSWAKTGELRTQDRQEPLRSTQWLYSQLEAALPFRSHKRGQLEPQRSNTKT